MYQIIGKHTQASVYAEVIDNETYAQILRMCNEPRLAGCKICMMPDTHAAAGCTVGTSIAFGDRINPAYVGDDIGCGMQVYRLKECELNLPLLDEIIRSEIPSGPRIHPHSKLNQKTLPLKELTCYDSLALDTVKRSFGTLGGGNHFIEVDRSEDGTLYLVIHSGSRRLGRDVARYHQRAAFFLECGISMEEVKQKKLRVGDINARLPLGSCMLEGKALEDYLFDMDLTVSYAAQSRKWMGEQLLSLLHLHPTDSFTTVHNYIDKQEKILRKGAVGARKDETLIIPINMKDGSLLCRGKGNPDWNFTAPHGAGRVFKRSEAQANITLEEYQTEMAGIYTTSVNLSTIDESPMAYRRIDEIYTAVAPTAQVLEILTPIYNFKASKPLGAEDAETADGED